MGGLWYLNLFSVVMYSTIQCINLKLMLVVGTKNILVKIFRCQSSDEGQQSCCNWVRKPTRFAFYRKITSKIKLFYKKIVFMACQLLHNNENLNNVRVSARIKYGDDILKMKVCDPLTWMKNYNFISAFNTFSDKYLHIQNHYFIYIHFYFYNGTCLFFQIKILMFYGVITIRF